MGTLDSIWKNVKVGLLGAGALVLIGNSTLAQENKKINIGDVPSIRPEWNSMVSFSNEFAIKKYDIDRNGEIDLQFVHPFSHLPNEAGIIYGPPITIGIDRNRDGKLEENEIYEIDYTNSQGFTKKIPDKDLLKEEFKKQRINKIY